VEIGLKLFGIGFQAQSFVFIAVTGPTQMAYNKLLYFVQATNNVASTGLPALCCGSQLAKR
jgi:hypothetical protein